MDQVNKKLKTDWSKKKSLTNTQYQYGGLQKEQCAIHPIKAYLLSPSRLSSERSVGCQLATDPGLSLNSLTC